MVNIMVTIYTKIANIVLVEKSNKSYFYYFTEKSIDLI